VKVVRASLVDGRVLVPLNQDGVDELVNRGYGVREGDALALQPYEALHLLERGNLTVESAGRPLDFQELLHRLSRVEENVWIRYIIYRDLRSRGYVVREGVGVGLDFRVYGKGEYGKKPAKYLVYGILEGTPIPVEKLVSVLQHAQNLKKNLILAVVDRKGEIVYYSLSKLSLG